MSDLCRLVRPYLSVEISRFFSEGISPSSSSSISSLRSSSSLLILLSEGLASKSHGSMVLSSAGGVNNTDPTGTPRSERGANDGEEGLGKVWRLPKSSQDSDNISLPTRGDSSPS